MATNHDEADPPSDEVEEIPTDPAERKRVLNVLAQRRYRRRKKQRQAMLETLIGHGSPARAVSANGLLDAVEARMSPAGVAGQSAAAPEAASMQSSDQSSIGGMALSALTPPWDDSLGSWLMLSLDPGSNSNSGASPSNVASLGDFLQEDDIEHCTFSDDFQIAVTELGLLRAGFENASRLHSAERLWDLQANSIFLDSDASSWTLTLPSNLQPTRKQLMLPHHPIIDILPWPAVRNKLIDIYALPPDFWPKHPEDGEACSLVRLMYDMEDGGVRVWGADPAAEEAWEVNDAFAKAWWWMLDQKVLRHSNQRRIARGEQPLRRIEASKN